MQNESIPGSHSVKIIHQCMYDGQVDPMPYITVMSIKLQRDTSEHPSRTLSVVECAVNTHGW